MSDYFLGVDGGATKTDAALCDEKGVVIARGAAAGSNHAVLGFESAHKNVKRAVFGTVGKKKLPISCACFALAGVNTPKDVIKWQREIKNSPLSTLLNIKKLLIVNDTLAALRAGTEDKNALVIIAGTGSSCWGRNQFGKEAKSGGVDYILGDEGSAYAIGSAILQAVTKALDGRGEKTKLKDLLFNKYKINSLEELINLVYGNYWGKVDIARVAPLAQQAVERGDPIAREILKKAAQNLVLMARTVASKLNLFGEHFNIVASGSVFSDGKIISGYFTRELLKFAPNAKVVKPKMESAVAAAFLAMEADSP